MLVSLSKADSLLIVGFFCSTFPILAIFLASIVIFFCALMVAVSLVTFPIAFISIFFSEYISPVFKKSFFKSNLIFSFENTKLSLLFVKF